MPLIKAGLTVFLLARRHKNKRCRLILMTRIKLLSKYGIVQKHTYNILDNKKNTVLFGGNINIRE